jgi:UTP--glucose-1-phosphate uridylyltransferase
LLDIYEFFSAPVLAVMEVPKEAISSYGCIDADPVFHNGSRAKCSASAIWWRNPKPSEAPSNLAIIGRYILTPDIFESIARVEPGSGGEIQLTDSIEGKRHLRAAVRISMPVQVRLPAAARDMTRA